MSFRLMGLDPQPFAGLFALSDQDLARHRGVRRTAANDTDYPCRVSLTDAARGDEVLLVNYLHQPADSPFHACHAIYIRAGEQRFDAVDTVPPQLRRRLLSLRGFDADGMLCNADVVEGAQLEPVIARLFENARVQYLHLHFARPGCYAARVERV